MTWDGFLPEHCCKWCGSKLRGHDSGYPAELYAGTYTGLCYSCTSSKPFMEKEWADGCQLWNFPPHQPSWRRDRETYFYHASCKQGCDHGRVYASRGQGGFYYRYCEYCLDKYCSNKFRIAAAQATLNVYEIGNKVYDRLCRKIEKNPLLTDEEKVLQITATRDILSDRGRKLLVFAKAQAENLTLKPRKKYADINTARNI